MRINTRDGITAAMGAIIQAHSIWTWISKELVVPGTSSGDMLEVRILAVRSVPSIRAREAHNVRARHADSKVIQRSGQA